MADEMIVQEISQEIDELNELLNQQGDLISRESMIGELRKMYNEARKWYDDAPQLSETELRAASRMATLVEIILRAENMPSAQQWIPVTERLPEPYSGEYLVTINNGAVYTDLLWFDSPGDGRHESCFYKADDDGHGIVCDDVVAWMPLPEPYKEGE